MPSFSQRSKDNLATCHPDLQRVFNEVIKHYDCTIICGHRNEEDQNLAFKKGHSKLKYPKSKHNQLPSRAVDVMPFPINWTDTKKHLHFAGFVMGIAASMGIKLRYGGDFNMDLNFDNDSFIDRPHYELI